MRHNFGSLIIRIVAFIVVVAFVSYGCSASRVVRKEIVRGKLEKTGVEKKYVNEQICLQELSPLQIKAMKISETKEIRKKYYRKKNIVETMRLQDLHPGRTTAEGTFVILASAFMIVITFGLALLVLAPAYKRDWKKAEEHEKENLNRCQYDGQVINGWRCTKDILEEEIAGDNAYETVQE